MQRRADSLSKLLLVLLLELLLVLAVYHTITEIQSVIDQAVCYKGVLEYACLECDPVTAYFERLRNFSAIDLSIALDRTKL